MLTWQLILIQIATFVLIVLALRWLLYSHISKALKNLHKLNRQNLAKEQALKEELARAKKQAAGEISRAKKQAAAIRENAKSESEQEAAKALGQAAKEAKRIVEEGTRESQRRVKEMTVKLQEKTAYLAADLVKYLLTSASQKNLQNQITEELIQEIKSVSSDKLKVEGDSVQIISAFELTSQQKAELENILSSKLNKSISLAESVDKDVVAGIILKSGGFVVDGSIRNKLKKVIPVLKEEAKKI